MSTAGDAASSASVAGSSVAVTEAEEDAASFAQTAASGDGGKVVVTKEASLDISIAGDNQGGDDGGGEEEMEGEGEYTPPMHLHALRTPAKLKGHRSRSSSRSRPGSRRGSVSPPPHKAVGCGELLIGSSVSPSISVSSSLDGMGGEHHELDPDILLDKLGFRDLDPNVTQEELQELLRKHISSNSGLPTLNERMSEETMDDVHAFQDLQFVKKGSKGSYDGEDQPAADERRDALKKAGKGLSNSAVLGSAPYLLNTLDEEGDEDEEGEEGEDVILEIPAGLVNGTDGKPKKGRISVCSSMAVASARSIDNDEDEDNAEVEVPTSVMNELKISDGERVLKHRDTSMAVAGSEMDFLEDDEQDGLEADLADEGPI